MQLRIEGTGDLARALAQLAAAAGHTVASDGADLVFLCVARGDVRAWARDVAPGPADRVVVATRGLEPGTGKRLSRVVIEETACLRVGALAGPILAGEVLRGSPCAGVVASRFDEVSRLGALALRSPLCRAYTTRDLPGVELAGGLVEVMTAALGAARGLGLGAAAQAMLVSRSAAEGARLAARQEGEARTFSGLAGTGELVASLAIPDHPGGRRGLALARGERDDDLAELCGALLAIEPNLPITAGVGAVAGGFLSAPDALSALMSRDHAGEWD